MDPYQQSPGALSLAVVPLDGPNGAALRITLAGELDLASAPRLETQISELDLSATRQLVLDLRELTFIDSTGLRTVLSIAERLAAGTCRLSLIRGPADVQRVFALTGTERELDFQEPSEADSGEKSNR